jgi:hypothetical protein
MNISELSSLGLPRLHLSAQVSHFVENNTSRPAHSLSHSLTLSTSSSLSSSSLSHSSHQEQGEEEKGEGFGAHVKQKDYGDQLEKSHKCWGLKRVEPSLPSN